MNVRAPSTSSIDHHHGRNGLSHTLRLAKRGNKGAWPWEDPTGRNWLDWLPSGDVKIALENDHLIRGFTN